jgi:hypothetical protein|tara:strand:- start:8 stop:172 length:165 start_codon:yes stop_codon:yes gene_type:complete
MGSTLPDTISAIASENIVPILIATSCVLAVGYFKLKFAGEWAIKITISTTTISG